MNVKRKRDSIKVWYLLITCLLSWLITNSIISRWINLIDEYKSNEGLMWWDWRYWSAFVVCHYGLHHFNNYHLVYIDGRESKQIKWQIISIVDLWQTSPGILFECSVCSILRCTQINWIIQMIFSIILMLGTDFFFFQAMEMSV